MEGGRGSGKSVIQCRRKISLTLSCLSVIVFSVHCDVNSLSPYAPPMMLCPSLWAQKPRSQLAATEESETVS